MREKSSWFKRNRKSVEEKSFKIYEKNLQKQNKKSEMYEKQTQQQRVFGYWTTLRYFGWLNVIAPQTEARKRV